MRGAELDPAGPERGPLTMIRATTVLAFAVALGGCELILGIEDANLGPDGEVEVDAGLTPRADGGPDTAEINPLGILCGPDHEGNGFGGGCPEGGKCQLELANWFDSDFVNGYCTLDCVTDDPVCSERYEGPPEGQPDCFDTTAEGFAGVCAVFCPEEGVDEACPEGMFCRTLTDDLGNFVGSGCVGSTWIQREPMSP